MEEEITKRLMKECCPRDDHTERAEKFKAVAEGIKKEIAATFMELEIRMNRIRTLTDEINELISEKGTNANSEVKNGI